MNCVMLIASFPGSPLAPTNNFVGARGEPGNEASAHKLLNISTAVTWTQDGLRIKAEIKTIFIT